MLAPSYFLSLAVVFIPQSLLAQKTDLEAKIPEAVKKTFWEKFPKGEIFKVDVEDENGLKVYDLEFKDGGIEKETDITTDGTMLEYTVVVEAKAVPEPALAVIRKAAEGATIKRIEWIEISHETKHGKTIKLPRPVIHYAVEMARGERSAEIVVEPSGKVLEEPRWSGKEKVEKQKK
jgi:hypothetical protein